MSNAAAVYRTLAAEERQEFRLPMLLKEHLSRAAANAGQSVTEYISMVLAERVTQDLAASTEWALSVDEQATLLRVLASAPEPTARARAIAERADTMFGEPST
ncbi:MAG: DUF1778 domain-containing protein [Ardenticatenia bacterium]|nr:DUF1778 domain-containing protein [Ardenticatenia bacterium]